MEIRSYRSVFALERRIYRIDTIRLNPSGVPLRGIAYAAVLVACATAASGVPPLSWLDAALPWYLRDLGLPVCASVVLTAVRIEGRVLHVAVTSIARQTFGPRALFGLSQPDRAPHVVRPGPILFIADGSEGSFRRMRYSGPGVALICAPHVREQGRRRIHRSAGRRLVVRGSGEGSAPRVGVALEGGAVLEVERRARPSC
jgi:hypothetical protein